MKQNKFKLSPAGKLVAAVAIISVSVATCYAAGIVSAGDSAHRPDVHSSNGTPIIDIVTPSASGLSHNQFDNFNVGNEGAVLNNAINSGNSQLAGQLNANQNLNGQAANVILNEVISRNPSLLLGKQEVFGMAADYILANPNGITCNGCGFINTNRTSLVVGNPLVDQGNLQGFDTRNNNNLLEVGEGSYLFMGPLDLITPRINMEGTFYSREDINVTLGQNEVSTDGRIIKSANYIGAAYDSKIFGSISANRIRIINTAEGNGVNMSGYHTARESIDISTPGKLNLDVDSAPGINYNPIPTNLSANDITISAGDIFTSGDIIETHSEGSVKQNLIYSKIVGKNISIIAKRKNHLDAATIDGNNIDMQGGDINLGAEKLTDSSSSYSTEGGKGFLGMGKWNKSSFNKEEKQKNIFTKINAKNNISIQSTKGDIKLSGSSVNAGNNISVKAKKDLILESVINQESTHNKGHDYAHTIKDKTWDNKETKQTLNKTTLQADGNLGLTAEGKMTTSGAKASAKGDLLINANQVKIDVQKTHDRATTNGKHEQNLGLGGIDHNNNDKNAETSHGSEITAEGKIFVSGRDGVSITGSKVKGTDDGFVQSDKGGIQIDNALSTTTTKIDERDGVAFNITGSSHKANNRDEKVTGSELVSDANLKIISKDNVDVIGSLVKSAGELGIETLGEINVKAAVEQQKIDEQKTKLTLEGFTHDDGNGQYQAGIKLEHTDESEKTESIKHQGATLEGGSVKLDAKEDVTFTGSDLVATKGDADIKGENVSFIAANDTTSSQKEKETVGVDVHYDGGMDKAGSGANVSYEDTQTSSDKSTAVVSGSKVAGNLNIDAAKDMTNQGSSHNVEGTYQVNADNVNNLAAENSEKTVTETTKADVGFGVNVAYDGITRPIEEMVNKAKEQDMGGMLDAVDDFNSPNAGVDIYAKGETKETSHTSSQSTGTSIKGGDIAINANGALKDQGTKYQADKGAITLDAASHNFEAAVDRDDQQTKETSGEAGIRIYTTTGEDITVDGKGKGGSTEQNTKGENAQVGSMNAANGVHINVTEDAKYQGTNINAGEGKVTINAGGNIHIDQATDHISENHNNVDANAQLNLGTNANSKEFGAGLGGGHSKGESNASMAQVSTLEGQQGIELNAGKDLTLTGTAFGSKEKPTGDIQLTADGKVDIQAAKSEGSKQDMTWSAGANAGISKGKDGNSKGMQADAEIKVAKTDESAVIHQGSEIHSNGHFSVQAGSDDEDAIHMQNANINSQKTTLNANNGGISLESAQDKQHKNNWSFEASANGSQSNQFNKDDKGVIDKQSSEKTHDVGAKLDVAVDKLDSVTQQNSHINSDNITLNTAKDMVLAGAKLEADNINGNIGGDLTVESRIDELHKVEVTTHFGAGHSNAKQESLINQIADASPMGSDKIKKKLDTNSNKLFDKIKNQYDQLSSKFTSKEEDNVKLLSYTKDGKKVISNEKEDDKETKDKWWQKGAKAIGNKVKNKVQNDSVKGGSGDASIEVEVVNNQAVEEQSAIVGKQTVNLKVKGKTELIGGNIANQGGNVDLQTNGLELQDVNGKHSQGGARVKGASSAIKMLGSAASDLMGGKTPLIGAHGGSEQKNAVAGITHGQP